MVNLRPYRDSAIRPFGRWIVNYDWDEALSDLATTERVELFLNETKNKYHQYFPLVSKKQRKGDKPWMTQNMLRLIKYRQQAFNNRNHDMDRWRCLRNKVQREIKEAKVKFYRSSIESLKIKQPGKWHREIQKLCYLKTKSGSIPCAQLDPQATAESINNHFVAICNQLPALNTESLPSYLPAEKPSPTIYPCQVLKLLKHFNPAKAGHPLDLPVCLVKEFADELTNPLTLIFNSCLRDGIFPDQWKTATVVPVPKANNITSFDQLRPISLTPIFGRIFESFLAKWIVQYISDKLDIKQYGNIKGSSTAHYLIDMLNFVLEGLDKPGYYANLCAIDFTKAFDRVSHCIVIKKLLSLGVRKSIVPTVCSFLTTRTQNTKLNGYLSSTQQISSGVPQLKVQN